MIIHYSHYTPRSALINVFSFTEFRVFTVLNSYTAVGLVARSLLDRFLALRIGQHLLVGLIEAGALLLLGFVDLLHVLHHLRFTRSDHVLVALGDGIVVSSLSLLRAFLALPEQGLIELKCHH